MHIVLLKHFAFDDASVILAWAEQEGCQTTVLFPPDGIALPRMDDFDWLIILGGPMSAYDKEDWLQQEKRFIRSAVDHGKHVLGICLGAQMLAEALGGKVYRNEQKEIGWHPVTRTRAAHRLFEDVPASFHSFHWHGDCFDLPEGALSLAYSDACRHQAFAYGERVLGLQFHLETTPSCLAMMLDRWQDELSDAPFIQTADRIRQEAHRSEESFRILRHILDRFAAIRTIANR
ncbi:type 1 glutamine amidotransferase [Paenibacillus validus]|uniref:type 1 glutamine amidotransferase n=1 Tax=Paenibacillus TaxID=44249 RepID=UPI000FDBA4D6|nr:MULTISPECIES: type 1 glutamine amidotransferase [Paenibacillus]MED4603490.1 type 1 glutamine amidotransferase [Paenibacillus validus]MED4608566.1 type 1 glutamine amidotransferase [Paenibacillus validus]